MRFAGVGTFNSNPFDLLITTQSAYRPANSAKNGLASGSNVCTGATQCDFGQINLKNSYGSAQQFPANGGSTCNAVDLRFAFCESGTGSACSAVTLPEVAFTLYDLDETVTNSGAVEATEQFYINPASYVLNSGDTAVCVQKSDGSTPFLWRTPSIPRSCLALSIARSRRQRTQPHSTYAFLAPHASRPPPSPLGSNRRPLLEYRQPSSKNFPRLEPVRQRGLAHDLHVVGEGCQH